MQDQRPRERAAQSAMLVLEEGFMVLEVRYAGVFVTGWRRGFGGERPEMHCKG